MKKNLRDKEELISDDSDEEQGNKIIMDEDIEKFNEEVDKKDQEMAEVANMNINMKELTLKIQNIVDVLGNFTELKEENKTRSEYIDELKHLCILYYDYNDDIMTLIFYLFPPNEAVEFLEANSTQKILSIRSNSLKTRRRELAKTLIQRGVNLDPLGEWTKVGLKIYESQVPLGATPEYLGGQYMLQAGSSLLPVMSLQPKENEKILDMTAAPGGKTTYLAQLMKNTGILVANDIKKERLKGLFFNVHRLGVKNCIITNYDGRALPKIYCNFDRVLLDAPCSGLGVIAKDPSIKLNRTYKDILQTTRIQKELILAAIDCCNHKSKTGGVIVYSTCSISVEENEWVIDYALKKRYVKVLDSGLEIGEEGLTKYRDKRFHPSVRSCRRIYPHIHNMDGFFVCKLQKYAAGEKVSQETKNSIKVEKGKKLQNLEENKEMEIEDIEEEEENNNSEEESKHKEIIPLPKKKKNKNTKLLQKKRKSKAKQ